MASTLQNELIAIVSRIFRGFAYAVVRILPKTRTAVLRGFPPYEDNLIAIYSALASRPVDRVVWVVNDLAVTPPVRLRQNTLLVKKGGLLDLYYSMTSRFLFITHGHFLRTTPPNQVSVNLWHGIPLKAVGRTLGLDGRSDTFLVATSDFTREIFAQALGMPFEKIIVTGQARTDRMLNIDKKEIWQRAFPDAPEPRKIFVWLPTFRDAPFYNDQADGASFANVFKCSDFSENAFNTILKDNDAFCLVKPHPMESRLDQEDCSNVRFIDEKWLHERGLSLYQIVGAADGLISDISSIIADFMLLDRPIILLFEDIELYEDSRGFSFNPITNFLPADVARNFDGFLAELKPVLAGDDLHAPRRAELKRLFFDHFDAGAAVRILDLVMGDEV